LGLKAGWLQPVQKRLSNSRGALLCRDSRMQRASTREVRASSHEVTGDLEAGTMDWHRERQDAETHLLAYRDRAKELRTRIRKLEALGPDSHCPTCGRLLEEYSQKVLEELETENGRMQEMRSLYIVTGLLGYAGR